MSLDFATKQAIVKKISDVVAQSKSVVAAEYAGLNVADMTQLRTSARELGVRLYVVKNTLARRVFLNTHFDCMCAGLNGQLVLAFVDSESGAAVKLVQDFAQQNDKLRIRLVAFNGRLLESSEITVLANLPDRETALNMLMNVMLAPITRMVRTVAEPHARLLRTIKAVADEKKVPD